MTLQFIGIYSKKGNKSAFINVCIYDCSVEASVIDVDPIDAAVETCQESMGCLVSYLYPSKTPLPICVK
jgi:hypothetical protein